MGLSAFKPAAFAAASLLSLSSAQGAAAQGVDGEAAVLGAASFLPPAGWRSETRPSMVRFEAPEGDLSLAIVDAGEVATARDAARAAWALFRPDDHHRLSVVTMKPGRHGWDEQASLQYEKSASEHLELFANAFRRGKAWTVLIVDGAQASAEKELGKIFSAQASLHPSGYKKESFAGRNAHTFDQEKIGLLRKFMQESIRELQIPGAAYAVVDNGRVVFEGGEGVTSLAHPRRVDANTRFMVASNTKGMTTLLLATLVDQGRLSWEQPVVTAYPSFQLGDSETTKAVRIRDLVCACTGLPRTDMEWLFDTPPSTPPSQTFSQLASMKPTSQFGQVFQYNNQMASAAGYIAGHIIYPGLGLGPAYERAMRDRIFVPLGMTRTSFNFPRDLGENTASPYSVDIDGKTAPVDLLADRIAVPYEPSAGAWSTAHDLIRYVQFELTKGLLPDGRRIVSQQNLLARRARGVSTGESEWYGMGLSVNESTGVPVVFHGGTMPGYISDVVIIPDAGVGAVLLTNASNGSALRIPFRRRILELLYAGKSEAAEDVVYSATQLRAEVKDERSKLALPVAPSVLKGLASHYENSELGPLTISFDNRGTRIRTRSFRSHVAGRLNDDHSVSLETIDPGMEGFQFIVGSQAAVPTLTLRDGQHLYVFRAQ